MDCQLRVVRLNRHDTFNTHNRTCSNDEKLLEYHFVYCWTNTVLPGPKAPADSIQPMTAVGIGHPADASLSEELYFLRDELEG